MMWPGWYKNGCEPLLHAIDQSNGGWEFMWVYRRSQGMYVVLPRPPKLRLIKNP